MDSEVRQAQRVIQRSGAKILTDAATKEELPFQYGEVMLQWLRRRGIPCQALQVETPQYGQTLLHLTAKRLLEKEVGVSIDVIDQFPFGQQAVVACPPDQLDSIIARYLSHNAPTNLLNIVEGIENYEIPNTKPHLFFLFWKHTGFNPPRLHVYGTCYHYKVLSEEEAAAEKAKIEKATQKKTAAAEKRRQTREAKEKAILKKLKAKYEDDVP